jgi:hypothetical protein
MCQIIFIQIIELALTFPSSETGHASVFTPHCDWQEDPGSDAGISDTEDDCVVLDFSDVLFIGVRG